ncbi:MAG: hypothetical protein IIA50_07095 [Bacteroidetes bacterium]|nr:hypothetical protein [Bacteroidota bacterium]
MRRAPEQIDEYILAAYLSGELPTRLRKEIAAYLVDNSRARELLGMATDALEVVESGDGAPLQRVFPADTDEEASENGEPDSPRSAEYSSRQDNLARQRRAENSKFLWRIVGLVSVAVLVLAITLAIHLLFVLRAGSLLTAESVNNGWAPVIEVDQLSVSWPSVPGAQSYRILLYDPVGEFVVSIHETSGTAFDGYAETVQLADAVAGGSLQIWIEAFDVGGNHMQSSKRVSVSFR